MNVDSFHRPVHSVYSHRGFSSPNLPLPHFRRHASSPRLYNRISDRLTPNCDREGALPAWRWPRLSRIASFRSRLNAFVACLGQVVFVECVLIAQVLSRDSGARMIDSSIASTTI